MTDTKIRILLVDDHMILRMGLAAAAHGEDDLEVVAEAEDGDEAVEAYREHQPDVVVIDLRMPRLGGFETIKRLKEEFGPVRVLVFSNYASGEEILLAFETGALGFVKKEMATDRLLEGIREVYRGNQYMPPEIAVRLGRRVMSKLTRRELEVLSLVAKGMSNKDIASTLELVEGTVKVHLTSIFSKLGVVDRTQAILAGVRMGIIEIE
ncbi:MAG: response regulator [Opitutales bacterium]